MSSAYRNRQAGDRGERPRSGQFTEARVAWITLPKFEAVIMVSPQTEEFHEQVNLVFRLPGRKIPFTITLASMTENELDELKKCIDFAFDQAKPIVQSLDAQAKEAWENGDDSWSRLYRPDAKFYTRGQDPHARNGERLSGSDGGERAEPEHPESVQERSAPGDGVRDGDPGEHLRGSEDG